MIRLIIPLTLFTLGCGAQTEQPILTKSCSLKVRLDTSTGSLTPLVYLLDEDGDTSLHQMTKSRDKYELEIALEPARYRYWIQQGNRVQLDNRNSLSVLHEETEVSWLNLSDCRKPDLRFVERQSGPNETVLTFVLARTNAEDGLDPESISATVNKKPIPFSTVGDHVYIDIHDLPFGKHKLHVSGATVSGLPFSMGGPFWSEASPFKWSTASMYQIVVDRFAGQTDFGPRARSKPPGYRVGGHLEGVIRKIESGYFDRLGINAIWLSPLYRNPDGFWVGVEGGPARYEGYHGYWPVRAREIEPKLGDAETLKSLVEKAHARGMRVILDVVPNHVHIDHEYYATHPEWFSSDKCICGTAECPWWRDIDRCWFTEYMPDVDWAAPGVLDRFVDDMVWWLDEFDLDGLRVDAVPMMPRLVIRHLAREVARRFETIDTGYYLLGETFTGPDGYDNIRYPLGPNGLDGQFDFPLMWAIRGAFAWRNISLKALFERWERSKAAWTGSASTMATIVGNHDVTRFATEANGGWHWGDPWRQPAVYPIQTQARSSHHLAMAFMLTMPGLPLIYYGDEYGEVGGSDPDNRRPMRFASDLSAPEQNTLELVRRIAKLRRCHPALNSGVLELIDIVGETASYKRVSASGDVVFVRLTRSHFEAGPDEVPEGYINVLRPSETQTRTIGEYADIATPQNIEIWIKDRHPCMDEI
ncbi:MAG: alpha-amylase family glycosyl hydrolase [Myxococcota bacterium]|nr:alpha-amylase family glycosyl hydrolase [Myxococcota bacterium]